MLLNLLKSVGTGDDSSKPNFSNLLISDLSNSDFKLGKSSFLSNCDVSTTVACFYFLSQILLHD